MNLPYEDDPILDAAERDVDDEIQAVRHDDVNDHPIVTEIAEEFFDMMNNHRLLRNDLGGRVLENLLNELVAAIITRPDARIGEIVNEFYLLERLPGKLRQRVIERRYRQYREDDAAAAQSAREEARREQQSYVTD